MKVLLLSTVLLLMGAVYCNPNASWEACTQQHGVWPTQGAYCLDMYQCARFECDPWYTPYLAELLYECATGEPELAVWITWMGYEPSNALGLFTD